MKMIEFECFKLSFAKTNNVRGPFQNCLECKVVKHDCDSVTVKNDTENSTKRELVSISSLCLQFCQLS